MKANQIITLLTDFGLSDVYVGVMKGAIAQVNPAITIIDLTHQIPPQNLAAGRFCLMTAYPYFPVGTVHIAVVDPGVGSNRRCVAIQLDTGYLVGPDNGLFSGIISQNPVIKAVELTNSKYWRSPEPSNTFHGRDIFATVGAYLASGIALEELGKSIEPATLIELSLPECSPTETGFIGNIQYSDRFGNLITNIPSNFVQGKTWSILVVGLTIIGNTTYSNSPVGAPIALIGSHGWIEVAINGGNAQSQLKLELGAKVELILI